MASHKDEIVRMALESSKNAAYLLQLLKSRAQYINDVGTSPINKLMLLKQMVDAGTECVLAQIEVLKSAIDYFTEKPISDQASKPETPQQEVYVLETPQQVVKEEEVNEEEE